MVVVIELQDGLGTGVSRPVFAVDEQDVGPAVVVVINERAARAHGFRQIFLAEGAVVVGEMDSGLSGDVTELDLLCGRENRREKKKKQNSAHYLVSRRGGLMVAYVELGSTERAWTPVPTRFLLAFRIGSGTDTCS